MKQPQPSETARFATHIPKKLHSSCNGSVVLDAVGQKRQRRSAAAAAAQLRREDGHRPWELQAGMGDRSIQFGSDSPRFAFEGVQGLPRKIMQGTDPCAHHEALRQERFDARVAAALHQQPEGYAQRILEHASLERQRGIPRTGGRDADL